MELLGRAQQAGRKPRLHVLGQSTIMQGSHGVTNEATDWRWPIDAGPIAP